MEGVWMRSCLLAEEGEKEVNDLLCRFDSIL